ncbi:MAG TPA: adenylate/guanylate cyclase domain-containing protein [Actinomycetota bacterium]|nr:adenylate/guanylate cyclase domain-containing protein [Actinomycetota bacterium]
MDAAKSRTGAFRRLIEIGSQPEDDEAESLRKRVLVLAASIITGLATVWVVSYALMGLYVSALIPFTYQVASVANLAVFARTKRYRLFRFSELALSLMLPFLLQLSLGGFFPSSAVVLWSFTAPLGALLFAGRRSAARWFLAFLGVVAAAALLDPIVPDRTAMIPDWVIVLFFANNILGVTGTSYLLLSYFVRERDRAAETLAAERERSERLLLNVLPEPIAARLKSGEPLIADGIPEVGVLFADIAGFTPMAERITPHEVVRLLDRIFSRFDALALEHGLEKIKTIGDAYMVASGLLEPRRDHAEDLARMALAMQDEVRRFDALELRIGIDIGPVVAGVIGQRKFSYDLWGDTVNTASRMESHGVIGGIHVTERARRRLADAFDFESRGVIDVKSKGPMTTYLLVGARPSGDEARSSVSTGERHPGTTD